MESRFVLAGEVRLCYFQHGDGPETVVLVHGYASSGRLWQLQCGRWTRPSSELSP